jgi:ribonuclease G
VNEDNLSVEGGFGEEVPSAFEMEASAEQAAVSSPGFRDQSPRGDFPQRDRGRGDGQRRDRESRPDRAQRVPRGFAPSLDRYGVQGSSVSTTGPVANAYPDANEVVSAEPIILPGESLSKYRKGGEEPAAAKPVTDAIPVTLAPPANLYTIAAGWDGGAVLPGETIRPRSGSAESRPEPRDGRRDRGRDRDGRRDGRPNRDGRFEVRREGRADFRNGAPAAPQSSFVPAAASVIQDVDGPSVAETPETQPEVVRAPHPEQYAASEILHETAAPVGEPVVEATSEAVPQPVAEYEPTEAAVSYRVDPLPRSEYRQSAPVLESEPELLVETEEVEEALVHESLAHTVTPSPEEFVEAIHASEDLPSEPVLEAHDITSISAAGEMLSHPIVTQPDVAHQPAPMEVAAPAEPIRHEGAVSVAHHAAFETPVPEAGTGFFAGSGELAEETLDDEEDLDSHTLHASAIEEMDYEEEALEGAADLGTMLREMSIDNITRPSPEVAEEDDFEEDDLEEDFIAESEGDDLEEEEEGPEGFVIDDNASFDESEEAARTGNAADQEFFEAQFNSTAEAGGELSEERGASSTAPRRDADRRGGRRDGRRDGRRGRSDRGDRPRSTGGSGDRERGGHGGRSRSAQATNLPAISDLLKPGQEILVQIAKEPIAKKGARITSHIALPGRFLVFMPTVGHTGVSRKIESDAERRRLKEILLSEKGEAAGGFIVRTAAAGASEEELRSDLRFLLNLWSDIKARSESSKSPALIYHDLNLIERILRDQVTDNFSAIWVDTETEYERVLRFLQRFQPSLIRRVKLYSKETPLFEQFGITEEINKALRSKVWLKSGGSIVINQTEALVAIDINTGKFVGKTARLEDTIVKTNLDAIPEIVRQIRLRDLGGIIIIDFIDMDERKNRNRVMAALEEELKADRAPSKVLQFNDFGLVAITRKRVKQSLERTLSTTCSVCTGTGMVKSPITVCNDIYVEMRKMHKHLDRGDVMLRVHPEVVKQLKTSGSKWLQEMEEMCGKTILVKSDPSLHPEQFDIH